MTKIIDYELLRKSKEFKESSIGAIRLSQEIPQCKLVRDFLSLQHLPPQAFHMVLVLSKEQLLVLGRSLGLLHEKVMEERKRLCVEYGVKEPDMLPHERRVFFDAALRSFIKREDHYP